MLMCQLGNVAYRDFAMVIIARPQAGTPLSFLQFKSQLASAAHFPRNLAKA
jgi:hypothetical protein